MAKLDVTNVIRGADNLLRTTENPRHRAILENYRKHAILEVCGMGDQIFDPELTVPEPVYYMNLGNGSFTLKGDEVKAFYQSLCVTDTTVMILEDEQLAVADWGFASEAIFNWYQPGTALAEQGWDVDDPDANYIARRLIAMVWKYDDRARMIGEHVYEHVCARELVKIPEADVVTTADAREKLLPLIRPLPGIPAAA